MTPDTIDILACPDCGGSFSVTVDAESAGSIEKGTLQCSSCGLDVPIVRHVPRFMPADNYAGSFGFQWNTFRATQLDSHSGIPISRDRFFRQSRWTPAELAGKYVLDVGCGAGRFAAIALSTGARVVAIDYSSAVDACFANLGPHPRLTVIQADVYHLPIRQGSFDYVYCFGVLQHTPDPHRAVLALAAPVAPGGKLAINFYARLKANLLWPKYWLRPVTRRMPQARLFALVQWLVPKLLPVSRALSAVPAIGRRLRYLLPVIAYYGVYPFTAEQHREWAILDAFDMLAPAHDHPQTPATVRAWLTEAWLHGVETERQGQIVGRATKETV